MDFAEYSMAVALGLIDPERSPFATKAKHVFWTDNPVGNALYGFLEKLVCSGPSRDETSRISRIDGTATTMAPGSSISS